MSPSKSFFSPSLFGTIFLLLGVGITSAIRSWDNLSFKVCFKFISSSCSHVNSNFLSKSFDLSRSFCLFFVSVTDTFSPCPQVLARTPNFSMPLRGCILGVPVSISLAKSETFPQWSTQLKFNVWRRTRHRR